MNITLQPGDHLNGLRNCPFCGKHGTVVDITENGSTVIRCDKNRGTGGCGASTATFPTREEALKAWNRRTCYLGKVRFEQEQNVWPYNLVTALFGTDDELNGVELTGDQIKGILYAIGTLTDREQDIILKYYKDGLIMEQIAKEKEVTRERIRQIIAKALRKLRNPIRAKYIKRGYAIASGEVAERARAAYQAEIDSVKEAMLAEAQAEVQRKIAEQTGIASAEDGQKWTVTLAEMELSVRPYNCLYKALGRDAMAADVLEVKDPEKIQNMGRKSCAEVAYKLKELGFDISGTGWELFTKKPFHRY